MKKLSNTETELKKRVAFKRRVLNETTALNNKKIGRFGNIQTNCLKEVSDISTSPLNNIWNKEIITKKKFFK